MYSVSRTWWMLVAGHGTDDDLATRPAVAVLVTAAAAARKEGDELTREVREEPRKEAVFTQHQSVPDRRSRGPLPLAMAHLNKAEAHWATVKVATAIADRLEPADRRRVRHRRRRRPISAGTPHLVGQ